MEGLLHYIIPFGLSWSYTCWSFEPLLKCLYHQTPSLAFYELWYPSTVQGSSPHKCDQKSSYSAFNVVVAALSQIFPSSYSSNMFVMIAPNSGVSWKVTLSDRICIRSAFGLSDEIFLLETPFPTFPLEYYFSGLWT